MTTISTPMLQWASDGVYKNITVMPNGNVVMIVPRTATSFRFYESSDRVTWTVKLDLTVEALYYGSSRSRYSAIVGHDGTYIILSYVCSDRSIKTKIITYATWAASASAIAWPSTTNITPFAVDQDVSIGGAVILGATYGGPAGDKVGYFTRVRTSAGAWVAGNKVTLEAVSTLKSNVIDMSVAWYKTASATVRRFTVLPSYGITSSDKGTRWIHGSVNETTGASVSIKDNGVLPYGNIGLGSKSAFSQAPRRNLLVGLTDPNCQAIAISSCTFKSGSTTILRPNHSAGVLKIKTPGANAAADVLVSNIISNTIPSLSSAPQDGGKCVTFSYDSDSNPSFNFLDTVSASKKRFVMSRVMAIADFTTAPVVKIREGGQWRDRKGQYYCMAGYTSVDYLNTKHDMCYNYKTSFYTSHDHAIPHVVTSASPATGALVASSRPEVGGSVLIPVQDYSYHPMEFYPNYLVALDPSFSTGVYTLDGTKKVFGAYNFKSPLKTSFKDQWTGLLVPSSSRYVRTYVRDVYGNQSAPVTSGPFIITHPASATLVKPAYSATDPTSFMYADPSALGYSSHFVSWGFSDAFAEDYQTAYQIIAKNSDNVTIYDSGKVTSGAKTAAVRVPAASVGMVIRFSVLLWDRYDQTSGVPVYGSLMTYLGPNITSFAPNTVDGSGNVNSRAPIFDYVLTEGTYPTVLMEASVSFGGLAVATTTKSDPGVSGQITIPPVLENNVNYTVKVAVVDARGLKVTKTYGITTLWTPPASPTSITPLSVSLAEYNVENSASILLQWSDDAMDADWVGWNIYRKINQIDPNTGLVNEFGSLELLSTEMTSPSSTSFRDFTAPSSVQILYLVRQVVDRLGAVIESTNVDSVEALPTTDGYWLIDPTPEDSANTAYKLWNVTSDEYTTSYESQITHILGRGNHEDRGDRLGNTGSLGAQLRDTGGTTARWKKRRLEEMKEEVRNLVLRTPFGDVFPVSVGDIQVSRIPGTGKSEFVDVTIPYTEVYQDDDA